MTTSKNTIKFLGRAPKYHHPKVDGIVQHALHVLDEDVPAHKARKGGWDEVTLPKGTCIAVTSGGMGPSGRRSWHGKLMSDGTEISIAAE